MMILVFREARLVFSFSELVFRSVEFSGAGQSQ